MKKIATGLYAQANVLIKSRSDQASREKGNVPTSKAQSSDRRKIDKARKLLQYQHGCTDLWAWLKRANLYSRRGTNTQMNQKFQWTRTNNKTDDDERVEDEDWVSAQEDLMDP